MSDRQYKQNVYAFLIMIVGLAFADFALAVGALTESLAKQYVLGFIIVSAIVLILPQILQGIDKLYAEWGEDDE